MTRFRMMDEAVEEIIATPGATLTPELQVLPMNLQSMVLHIAILAGECTTWAAHDGF